MSLKKMDGPGTSKIIQESSRSHPSNPTAAAMGLFCLLADFKTRALEQKGCTQEHQLNSVVIAELDSSTADFQMLGEMNVYSCYRPSKRMQDGLTEAAQQKVVESMKISVLQQILLCI